MIFSWFFLVGFLRKVYGILTVQLLFTTVVGAIFLYNENVKNFVQERLVYISIHFFFFSNNSVNMYLQRLNFHQDKYANKVLEIFSDIDLSKLTVLCHSNTPKIDSITAICLD